MNDLLNSFKNKIMTKMKAEDLLKTFIDFLEEKIITVCSEQFSFSLTNESHNNYVSHIKNLFFNLSNFKFDLPNKVNFIYFKNELTKDEDYLNFLLSIFKTIIEYKIKIRKNYYDFYESTIIEMLKKIDNDFVAKFPVLIDNLRYFSINFDEEKWIISSTEHSELIKKINFELIEDVVYNIKSSSKIKDKSIYMGSFAKNMLHILQKNSNYRTLLNEKFNINFLDVLHRECNGFFRHNIQDSGDKVCTQKWIDFSAEKKEEIINKTLTYYLSILAILRDENMIDEFIKDWS